jgi:hypothetical protein
MKKQVLFLAFIMTGFISVNAQPGGGFRRTVEERVAMVHQKLDSAFHFDAAKQAQIDTVFANFYRKQDAVRQELMSGGERPDMQVMRDRMQPIIDGRDKELKVLLGDDKFTIWKNDIEPAMNPRRGPGGGGRN